MSASPEIAGIESLFGLFAAERQRAHAEQMRTRGLPAFLPSPPAGLDLRCDLDGLHLDLAWRRGLAGHLAPTAYLACAALLVCLVGPSTWIVALVAAAAALQAVRALSRPRALRLTPRALFVLRWWGTGVVAWSGARASVHRLGGVRLAQGHRRWVLGSGLPEAHQRWLCAALLACAAHRGGDDEGPEALRSLTDHARSQPASPSPGPGRHRDGASPDTMG